ncbi:hypothetical protein FNV43_RR15806 [Rhamnella rubrinervis]|uniref:RING-type E3 ubiquitin transferase n=1 Tax=Rhamnella rubrinervis TaxID=2594499 RepID=A0A8K0E450_9ROSA|nr:hypothetical protein FNV43_RR15806 [Rhamnella rubrinervis]
MIRVVRKFQAFSLAMNQLRQIIILLLCFVLSHGGAQSFGTDYYHPDVSSELKPSIAVVIGILCVMFVLTFILLVYAKVCHRSESVHGNLQNQQGLITRSSRFSGIDKTVIESLPFFRFSSLKGSREGLECAVCLSKFEDVEVLRLLPKCKHAFHINCIDHWLEKHSSCPLCRHRLSSDDLAIIAYSNSMRFSLNNQSELREDSNIELFVQREESSHHGSSRFSIGSSFRKIEKGDKEEECLIQEEVDDDKEDQKVFHKRNHKIVVSDFMFKNRWSSVTSSDLMFLSSEMLNHMSSNRFSSSDLTNEQLLTRRGIENEETLKIKEEMEMKRSFENKVSTIKKSSDSVSIPVIVPHDMASSSTTSRSVNEKRSMSEITALSRYENLGVRNRVYESYSSRNNVKEERIRRLWLPIARRTVQWFASRENKSQQPQQPQQPLDV